MMQPKFSHEKSEADVYCWAHNGWLSLFKHRSQLQNYSICIQNNVSKRFDSESPPGTEHQINPPLGFVCGAIKLTLPPLRLFYFCFEPNDWNDRSRPAKPRVKTNYLPCGIPLMKNLHNIQNMQNMHKCIIWKIWPVFLGPRYSFS
jgi:hypothetical protein